MATRIGKGSRRLGKAGPTRPWQPMKWGAVLFLALFAGEGLAAPPIEALQRSVQQRWSATAWEGGTVGWPLRSDGATPPVLPKDGYYGADLDDPVRLKALVDDLSSKVGSLANQYSTVHDIEGSAKYMYYSYWGGVWTFDETALPKVNAVLTILPDTAPIDERVERLKQMLRMMKTAPIRLMLHVMSGSTTVSLTYVKWVSASSVPVSLAAYPLAVQKWNQMAPVPVEPFNQLDTGDIFYASSSDFIGGFGEYDQVSLNGNMGNLTKNVGIAKGTLDFYLQADANPTLPGVPVEPDEKWHKADSKSGSGPIISKFFGGDPPAPKALSSGGWNIRRVAGMFHGDFKDDWKEECTSCGCSEGGVYGSDGSSSVGGSGSGGGAMGGGSGGGTTGSSSIGLGGGMGFSLDLGGDSYGANKSTISLRSSKITADLINPDSLAYSLGDNGEVIRVNNTVKQVATPTALVEVAMAGTYKLVLKQYPAPTVAKQPDGTYPVGGQPLRTVTIEKPIDPQTNAADSNAVRITVDNGSRTDVSGYKYTPATGAWEYIKGDGASHEFLTPIWNQDRTERTEWRQVYNGEGVLQAESKKVYRTVPWGEALASEVLDPNGAALTTTYTYYEVTPQTDGTQAGKYGRLKQRLEANGHWERYDYDSYGRQTKLVAQWLDTAPGSAEGSNRVITTTYGTANPAVTEVETVLGAETRRHYRAYFANETREIDCTVPGAAWNAATNLVTTTRTISGGTFSGKTKSITQPDGTLTTYEYQQAVNGSTQTTTVSAGAANGAGTSVVDGQRTITVVDPSGNQISQTVIDIASGLTLTTATRTAIDDFGRTSETTYDDGSTTRNTIGCCGPQTSIDREGVVTTYTYDALGLVSATTRDGLTMLAEHDALGRTVTTKRQGTDDSVQVVTHTRYDLAGRIVETRDALDRSIVVSESFDNEGHLVRTATLPDGSTQIETFYKDGQQRSVGGTSAHPISFEHGVEDITPLDGSLIHARFTKETRIGAGGATTEWAKSYQDMIGRNCRLLQANGGVVASAYNVLGQLVKTVDPDGVTMLYTYAANGEREVSALDMNRNGTIDYAGSDRIAKAAQSVLAAHGMTVQRRTIWQWNEDSQNSSVVASQVDVAPNGRHTWSSSYGLTTEVVVDPHGDGTTTTTTTFPDGSTLIRQSDHGRVTSLVRKGAGGGQIGGQNYGYSDPFKRVTHETDARNGSTTYQYYADDQLKSVTTPAPGDGSQAQTTTYFYEAKTGRKQREQQPDGGIIHTEYWPTGEVKKTYGVRTYPMEYTYDSQGRLKTLTTHGAAGAAVTTWNYSPVSGFLTSKQYADSNGPSYTNTLAGRVASRTWARGIATSYARNNAGEASGIGYSDGTTPSVGMVYDRRGQLATMTDAVGTRIETPIIDGQAGDESYTTGMFAGININRSYDALRRSQELALTVGVSTLATGYGYDGASRLESVTGAGVTTTYGYVGNSSLVGQIGFSVGGQPRMTTTKTYDLLNRLSSTGSVVAGQPTLGSGTVYNYNASNERVRAVDVDGSRWDYDYDLLGQVTSGSKRWANGQAVIGQQYGYNYDPIGNRTGTKTNGRSASYAPNLLNQYTNRTIPGAVDVLGTAKSDATVTVNGATAARQHEYFAQTVPVDNSSVPVFPEIRVTGVRPNGATGGDDLISQKSGQEYVPATPEDLTYDLDGNLTGDGRWTYTWDGENQLIGMEVKAAAVTAGAPKQKLQFVYDGYHRRVQKIVWSWNASTSVYVVSSVIGFVYDGWNLVAELDGSNNLVRGYVWGLDVSNSIQGAGGVGGLLIGALFDSGKSYITSYDGSGNVIALIDTTDNSSNKYEYGPFGELLRATGPLVELNPFRFSTKYTDLESGLVCYGYRHYHPSTGRWISKDPVGEAGGENLYALVGNRVLQEVDFLGLADIKVTIVREYFKNETVGKFTAVAEKAACCGKVSGYTLELPEGAYELNPWLGKSNGIKNYPIREGVRPAVYSKSDTTALDSFIPVINRIAAAAGAPPMPIPVGTLGTHNIDVSNPLPGLDRFYATRMHAGQTCLASRGCPIVGPEPTVKSFVIQGTEPGSRPGQEGQVMRLHAYDYRESVRKELELSAFVECVKKTLKKGVVSIEVEIKKK